MSEFNLQATVDAVELVERIRHEEHAGRCNAATGILYRIERRLDQQVREYLTGTKG